MEPILGNFTGNRLADNPITSLIIVEIITYLQRSTENPQPFKLSEHSVVHY